ncbi:hypothetical protein V5O48_001878 [Marasmius crinis-equi]|uniref:N-acetyltransferase domain-containing protein n=1 Tax=Marasmius crinis-equi TaxID=585013 RepID=A0ABR3FX39_9AGAR
MFNTERLHLRAGEESDVDLLRKLWHIEDVQKTISINHLRPQSPDSKEKFLSMINTDGLFVIIETKPVESDAKDAEKDEEKAPQFVGFAQLAFELPKHRDAQYAIALMPEFWGKGYASEVTKFVVDHGFHHFGLHRISLGVLGGNDVALKLYKKTGFVEEGRRREAFWLDGEWRDNILMSILEREWRARREGANS